jgi:hypothetical protein
VRFEQAGVRDLPHAMALRVCVAAGGAHAEGVRTRIPTTIVQLGRRARLQQVYEAVYTDRDVFAHDAPIVVHWQEDLDVSAEMTVRLQSTAGHIYGESYVPGEAGDTARFPVPSQMPAGPYQLLLIPRPRELYEDNVRIRRTLDLYAMGTAAYSGRLYGTYPERRQDALLNATQRSDGLFGEVAKMALGLWPRVEGDAILLAAEGVKEGRVGSARDLVGLLGMLSRFGDDEHFPSSLREPLEECILRCRYGHDEPEAGADEGEDLLWSTAEIMAGQRYSERTFADGRSGRQLREEGERLALSWLQEKAAWGLDAAGSNAVVADALTALSHLIDLAEPEQLFEMATVVMDKLLFTVALTSYRGVPGGGSDAPYGDGGLVAPTAGITRLLWGMGAFNQHLAGTVSLACLENYQLPLVIPEIAVSLREEMWDRERHGRGECETNRVTYRTPDYMLSSLQSYRPGRPGTRERVWQASLGPEAAVFVTHPARARDSVAPGFWRGNRVLPRVAQWRDALIAVHNLPADDWLGFTHAYFPIHAFDEYALRDGWAFARKGEGYLALAAAQGLALLREGHSAFRELRSYGRQNIWLCQMGRAALDGDFQSFQEKVLQREAAFAGLSVTWETLRGERLSFGWEDPLLRGGEEVSLSGFKHYENPYCVVDLPASEMEVRTQSYVVRLSLT